MGQKLSALNCCKNNYTMDLPPPSTEPEAPPHSPVKRRSSTGSIAPRTSKLSSISGDSMTAKLELPPNPGPAIGEEKAKLIVDHARKTLDGWQTGASAHMAEGTEPLRQDHKQMAALLDGIYKHHFGSSFGPWSVDSVPDDATLQSLYVKAYGKNSEGAFLPKGRQTMEILYEDFEQIPRLKDVPADDRWRLMIDRQKVEMLDKHGIDTSNPMLVFLYDRDQRYAHGLAQGYKLMGEALAQNRDLDVSMITQWAKVLGSEPDPYTVKFAAAYTPAGRRAVAELAEQARQKYGIRVGFQLGDELIVVRDTGELRKAKIPGGNLMYAWALAKKTDGTLVDELEAAASRHPQAMLTLVRGDMTPAAHTQAMEDLVQACKEGMAKAKTSDEKVKAAAKLYFEGEHLHLLSDANYRVFGKLLLNFALGKQGEPLCDIYDPNQSDGRAPQELLPMIREGQAWLANPSPQV